MKKKLNGIKIPGYQVGGKVLEFRPNNDPNRQGPFPETWQTRHATNGMMMDGGRMSTYLDMMASNPSLNMMATGGTFTQPGYPMNGGVMSIDDIGRQPYKEGHSDAQNGYSSYKYGGQFMPTPLEYAYLMNGGNVDTYNRGGYAEYGGTADNDGDIDMMKSGGIHIKPENRGKFTAYKKRTGRTTEEALHSSDPHVRKMANFARNAAKWKHEYGGPANPALQKFMQSGGVTDDSPISGGISVGGQSTFAPIQTAADTTDQNPNSQQTMADVYRPVQQQNQNLMYNADYSQNSPDNGQGNTAQQRHRPDYAGTAGNLLGTGLALSSFYNSQDNAKRVHQWGQQHGMTDSAFSGQRMIPGSRGDYDQQGQFKPNQNTPISNPGIQYAAIGQYGGHMAMGGYVAGSEHEMDDETISRLQKMGYKLKFI